MKPFTRNEVIGIGIILLTIAVLTSFNLRISLRRSRDSQRRSDIGAVTDALYKYHSDFGFFPPSTENGLILACRGENFGNIPDDIPEDQKKDYFFKMLRGCEWGKDFLRDVNDDAYTPYLSPIPADPRYGESFSYFYTSNMNRFQIYAYLEGGSAEVGFRDGIVDRNLACGINVCNFGKAYGETPLEKSIEEYEAEINQRK